MNTIIIDKSFGFVTREVSIRRAHKAGVGFIGHTVSIKEISNEVLGLLKRLYSGSLGKLLTVGIHTSGYTVLFSNSTIKFNEDNSISLLSTTMKISRKRIKNLRKYEILYKQYGIQGTFLD